MSSIVFGLIYQYTILAKTRCFYHFWILVMLVDRGLRVYYSVLVAIPTTVVPELITSIPYSSILHPFVAPGVMSLHSIFPFARASKQAGELMVLQ